MTGKTTTPFKPLLLVLLVLGNPRTCGFLASFQIAAGHTTVKAAPITAIVADAVPARTFPATRFEDTDLTITYTPGSPAPRQPPSWFHGSRSRNWSGDTASFNRSAGARATFRFTGTSVSWIGFRAFWAGIAHVYLDDVFVAELDLFLPPCTAEQRAQGCMDEDAQVPVFTASELVAGPHTLIIESTGRKHGGHGCEASPTTPVGPDCSSDYAVVADAFDVAPAAAPLPTGTRAEEATATYAGAWTQDTTRPWSGNTARVSAAAGAQATLTFVGTEVRWIGLLSPNSGIADVYLDSAFHARVDTYSQTDLHAVVFTATGLAPAQHTLTIVATGSSSPTASNHLVAVDAFDVRARFEERDASLVYDGTWVYDEGDRAWSGSGANTGAGTASRSATQGARAEFTFRGTEVRWIGARGPWAGIADVSVDGVAVGRIDLYAPAEELRVPVFETTGLTADVPHRIRIDVTGLRNGAATAGGMVVVDAFDVVLRTPAPAVKRVQQSDSSVTFSADGWNQSGPNILFSGRTMTFSTTAGARTDFTFKGTAIRWIGQRRRDSGIALVYLDGAFTVEIDTFAPVQDEFQAPVFTATGLDPAVPHRLTIEVSDRKHGGNTCSPAPGPVPPPCSAGHWIVIDAFDVY